MPLPVWTAVPARRTVRLPPSQESLMLFLGFVAAGIALAAVIVLGVFSDD